MAGDDLATLTTRLRTLAEAGPRRLAAIAGPPGAGKSTLAEALHAALEESHPGQSAILPMDGFHLDDGLLAARGDLARKGAPHTFDLDGFRITLERLARDDAPVIVPVFDRALEISRGGARMIGPERRLLIVEGNYLLLDLPGWADLRETFDLTVFLDVPYEVLRARLAERWASLPPDVAMAKLEANDLPNARLVLERSGPADIRLR
ncbi:pantothenate kinase [Palleronia aestuarii]|uniref:Pantothenate kinase n=1 Tax=Palleronia aestuarii TaxID=568105 RepID=A0A2W7N653_9RHOB|nr:nucleoside/nucleotide kinase family protein [Palleronia aestuarii]PZX13777.1 pantothenate kinase [Palleronia aestuarii]